METTDVRDEAERIFSSLRSFRDRVSGNCPSGICSYLAEACDLVLRKVERGKAMKPVSRPGGFSSRFSVYTLRSVYPFGAFIHSERAFLVSSGKYLWRVFENEENAEMFLEDVDRGRDPGNLSFLAKGEFEENVVGPMLGIDGRILSSVPRDERYVLTLHHSERLDETLVGSVDLLTGYGCYFSGRSVAELKRDVSNAVSAESLVDIKMANAKFDFFDIRNDCFVVKRLEEFPEEWRSFNPGKVFSGEERRFGWWREDLLRRHGFSGTDFSGADGK